MKIEQDHFEVLRKIKKDSEQPLLDFRLYWNADRFSLKEARSGVPGNRTPLKPTIKEDEEIPF